MTRTRIGLAIGIAAALAGRRLSAGQARSRRDDGDEAARDRHLALAVGRLLRPGQGGDARLPALGRAGQRARRRARAARSQLKIVDDTSSPNQVVTNYQNLISRDKVDLVFGPFSTLLTAPAARVAYRYHYAFVEPAGGGPAVFAEHLGNVFFVQPAPVLNSGDAFVKYILSLPKSKRPKTAAYPSLDDPFSSPIADRMRSQFEKAGHQDRLQDDLPAGDDRPHADRRARSPPPSPTWWSAGRSRTTPTPRSRR